MRADLIVVRDGARPRKVTLNNESFRPETVLGVNRNMDNSWNYYVDARRKVAQVRIAAVAEGTAAVLHEVLTQLQADGLRGLILDLRWCPGGYLTESVNIARLFLSDGIIATVRYRTKQQDEEHRAASDETVFDFALVVLVNSETSGGAELIAAALQDHKRALISGERSLGKASVQTLLALPVNNAGLKLTSGQFARPSGKALHRSPDSKPSDDWGVRPAARLTFPVTPDLSAQLRDWWLLQTLRPGWSNELLPLDDPDNDPQRQGALRVLLRRLKDPSKDRS
jgi:carboxyl-terminal processing protease